MEPDYLAPFMQHMANRNFRTKTIAAAVRMEFLRRGLKPADVGLALGVSGDHVSNVVSGSLRSRSLQVQLEGFLGMPFWSSLEDFRRRQWVAETGGQASAEKKDKQNEESKY